MRWQVSTFHHLTNTDLYQLLRLRSEVFVVEQNCVFLDMDNYDQQCWHLLGWDGHLLAASARLVPPGLIYDEISIGRVVSSPLARGKGSGKQLMTNAIAQCMELFGRNDIRIGAQYYLKDFYTSFGFEVVGDIYMEDGIEHVKMLLKAG